MKSTGIVRNVDELGRIVIPKELRKKLGMNSSDPVEIFVENDRIILEKYEERCIFCSSSTELSDFKEKKICRSCIESLNIK